MKPEFDFLRRVFGPDTCWEWPKSRSSDGYGRIGWNGMVQSAHRVAYELFIGPIPEGLTIDHLCRNRACVNPEHMQAVPHAENCRRRRLKFGDRCARGHLLAEDTVSYHKSGRLLCRACIRDRSREYKARQRLKREGA